MLELIQANRTRLNSCIELDFKAWAKPGMQNKNNSYIELDFKASAKARHRAQS